MSRNVRLGVIIPSGNVILEPDFYRMCPKGVSIHAVRIPLFQVTEEGIRNLAKEAPKKAQLLADAQVDVIGFGCTGGSFYGGIGYDKEIIKSIQETVGIPTTTTSTAVVEAFKRIGAKKVSIATPYEEWLDKREKEFFEANGFKVLNIEGLKKRTADEIANVSPEEIYRFGKRVCKPDADCLFISCTDFRAVETINDLENDLEKPVITSNQATCWMMLRMAGVKRRIEGFGKLLTLV